MIPSEPKKCVVNLSSKPLSSTEQSLLEKGLKFAPTPSQLPYKNIVAEIEAAITNLADESKEAIRTSAANILQRSKLPNHKNMTTNKRKAINRLRKDKTCLIMKADMGNCLVVMDRSDYDEKMQKLLDDNDTYEKVSKSPFKRIKREFIYRNIWKRPETGLTYFYTRKII